MIINGSNKVHKTVSAIILAMVGLAIPTEQAYAASAGIWNGATTLSSFNLNSSPQELYSNLDTNKVYLDNNLGGAVAVAKLTAAQVAALDEGGNAYSATWNKPIVFGSYDPATYSGTIYVTKFTKMPDGGGIIEMAQFTPSDGDIYANDFEGTNPFWQFIPNSNGNGPGPNPGSFVSITSEAFYTAVGLVMQHANSAEGWIATDNTNAQMSTSSSSSIFTVTVTHREKAYTTPSWTAVLPEGASIGQSSGYLVPINGTQEGSPGAAVAALSTDQNAHNAGAITPAYVQMSNGVYMGQMEVNGGYVYVPAGTGANLPTNPFLSFQHTTTQSGFSGLFFMVIGFVLGGLTGFLSVMLVNVVDNGSPGFFSLQTRFFGGNCGGSAKNSASCSPTVPESFSASYNSAQSYDGYAEGYINADTNPTQSTSQWDWEPQESSESESNPNSGYAAQTSIGSGFGDTKLTPGEVQKGDTVQQIQSETQENSSGNINFDSQTGGVTPPSLP